MDKSHTAKLIIAVVKPWKKAQIVNQTSLDLMLVKEVIGYGRQMGNPSLWKRAKYSPDFLPKIQINTSANGENVENVIEEIIKHARTGDIGDGKIFVLPVEKEINI